MKAEEGAAAGGTGAGKKTGGGGGGGGGGLKKGPWTPAEDAILMEHVRRHGEGNWNAVQRHSGLARCGKSCRLRWANHLRPNLKKGSFSPEEELLILRLHAQLGNKWARMAAQLPGRTDNEIKNYWNTRLKRRQRAGLPIYPPELKDAIKFDYHHQMQHQASTSSPAPQTMLSPPATDRNAQLPSLRRPLLLDAAAFRPPPAVNLPPLPRNLCTSHFGFGFPLSPLPTATPLFRQQQQEQQFGPGNFDVGPPPPLSSLSPLPRPFPEKLELPSSQLYLEPPVGGHDVPSSCGLLEALLHDSHVADDMKIWELLALPAAGEQDSIWGQMLCSGDGAEGIKDTSLGCSLEPAAELEGLDCDVAFLAGTKVMSELSGDAKTSQGDISALFHFPAPTISIIPDWCNTDNAETTNGQSPAMVSNELGLEMHQLASSFSISSADHEWNVSSWPWNNMPGIC